MKPWFPIKVEVEALETLNIILVAMVNFCHSYSDVYYLTCNCDYIYICNLEK